MRVARVRQVIIIAVLGMLHPARIICLNGSYALEFAPLLIYQSIAGA
jgi:hypothetical protein